MFLKNICSCYFSWLLSSILFIIFVLLNYLSFSIYLNLDFLTLGFSVVAFFFYLFLFLIWNINFTFSFLSFFFCLISFFYVLFLFRFPSFRFLFSAVFLFCSPTINCRAFKNSKICFSLCCLLCFFSLALLQSVTGDRRIIACKNCL